MDKSIHLDESEIIKNSIDFSFKNNSNLFDENNYLKNSYFIKTNFRKISKNLVLNVVKSRLDEIFEILKKQLTVGGFNPNSGVKLLLTGKQSTLSNLEKYCSNFFGFFTNADDSNDEKNDISVEKNFVSSLGALKIIKDGWETEAIPEISDKNIKKISFFAKIFGNRW